MFLLCRTLFPQLSSHSSSLTYWIVYCLSYHIVRLTLPRFPPLRSLEQAPDHEVERVQALRLVRACIDLAPTQLPHVLASSLAAVVAGDPLSGFTILALETLCELGPCALLCVNVCTCVCVRVWYVCVIHMCVDGRAKREAGGRRTQKSREESGRGFIHAIAWAEEQGRERMSLHGGVFAGIHCVSTLPYIPLTRKTSFTAHILLRACWYSLFYHACVG